MFQLDKYQDIYAHVFAYDNKWNFRLLLHLSDTFLRSKKMLLLLKKIIFLFTPNGNLFGAEMRVNKMRQAS